MTVISVNIVYTITPNIYKFKCEYDVICHVKMYSIEFSKLSTCKERQGEREAS